MSNEIVSVDFPAAKKSDFEWLSPSLQSPGAEISQFENEKVISEGVGSAFIRTCRPFARLVRISA